MELVVHQVHLVQQEHQGLVEQQDQVEVVESVGLQEQQVPLVHQVLVDLQEQTELVVLQV